jgi:hypothetical protein
MVTQPSGSGRRWTIIASATSFALLALVVWAYEGAFLAYSDDILRSTQIFRNESQLHSEQKQQQLQNIARLLVSEYVSPVANSLHNFLRKHNCIDVYLDLGSNIGVQVRKLYQPSCFPGANALSVFEKAFGIENSTRRQAVCALGFEPNMRHISILEKTQHYRQSQGKAAMFFTNTAVAGKDVEKVTFYTDSDMRNNEWGAGLLDTLGTRRGVRKKTDAGSAHVVGLHTILTQLKIYGKIQALVMKIDVEGSEYDAVPGMQLVYICIYTYIIDYRSSLLRPCM